MVAASLYAGASMEMVGATGDPSTRHRLSPRTRVRWALISAAALTRSTAYHPFTTRK
jgi:hypothetical protein